MGVAEVAIAATLVSTAVAGYSQYQQGQAQSANASYQSQVASNNAKMAQINAEAARKNAAVESSNANAEQRNSINKSRAIIGAQEATTASRGLLVGEGSALDLRTDTARLYGETNDNIAETGNRRNADQFVRAFNYETGAVSSQAESGLLRTQADSAAAGSLLGAAGTVAGGLSSAGGRYYDMTRTGRSFTPTQVAG